MATAGSARVYMTHPEHAAEGSDPAVTTRDAFDRVWKAKGYVEVAASGAAPVPANATHAQLDEALAERGTAAPSGATKADKQAAIKAVDGTGTDTTPEG